MANQLWLYLGWVLAAGLLGLAISAVLSGRMRLSRRLFLVPYFVLTALFLYCFCRWNQLNVTSFLVRNWLWGMLAGAVVGVFLVRNVLSQPTSMRSTGVGLFFDVLWLGLGYGAMDALLLNVMPVVSVWSGFSKAGWTVAWSGRIAVGILALLASLLVTLLYHLGYPEFRNRRVALVLFGNILITSAYLVSTNPLGAVVSHVVMHVAAVFQGPERTIQLPPHYSVTHQSLT